MRARWCFLFPAQQKLQTFFLQRALYGALYFQKLMCVAIMPQNVRHHVSLRRVSCLHQHAPLGNVAANEDYGPCANHLVPLYLKAHV